MVTFVLFRPGRKTWLRHIEADPAFGTRERWKIIYLKIGRSTGQIAISPDSFKKLIAAPKED